jgi:hypothetical protein
MGHVLVAMDEHSAVATLAVADLGSVDAVWLEACHHQIQDPLRHRHGQAAMGVPPRVDQRQGEVPMQVRLRAG